MSNSLPPNDPTLLLLQRISDDQTKLADSQRSQVGEQHAVRLLLAEMSARLEPLGALPSAFADLRLQVAKHEHRLATNSGTIATLAIDVSALKTTSATRSGWETFGGKLLILLGGSAITLAVGALFVYPRVSKAEPASDMRMDNAANAKCWAVPAPKTPKWLAL